MAPSQLDSGVNNRPRLTLWTSGITDPVILIISINIPSWFSRDPCSVKCVTSFDLFVDFSYQMNLRGTLELLVTSPRFHIPSTSFWRNYPSFPREILQEVPEALPLPARWPSRSFGNKKQVTRTRWREMFILVIVGILLGLSIVIMTIFGHNDWYNHSWGVVVLLFYLNIFEDGDTRPSQNFGFWNYTTQHETSPLGACEQCPKPWLVDGWSVDELVHGFLPNTIQTPVFTKLS